MPTPLSWETSPPVEFYEYIRKLRDMGIHDLANETLALVEAQYAALNPPEPQPQ